MEKKRNTFLGLVVICLATFLIFQQFFVKGLYPFPGNFLLAWFEPWKSQHTTEQTITISHKPIADDVFRQLFPFKVLAINRDPRHIEPAAAFVEEVQHGMRQECDLVVRGVYLQAILAFPHQLQMRRRP